MEKESLLSEIKQAAAAHVVTKDEVAAAYESGLAVTDQSVDHSLQHKLSVTDIMYYIGGAIVALGIAILVGQNWERLGTPVQILVTLGSAIAAYVVGVLFTRYQDLQGPSVAFFLISGIVMPLGLAITLDKAGLNLDNTSSWLIISGVLFAVYLASFFLYKKGIFTLFSIIFGTWLFQVIIQLIIGSNPLFYDYKIYAYRTLVTGLAYMLIGYYFTQTSQRALSGALYAFGSIGFLGAAMVLGGYSPNQNVFWELIYPLLVFGIIFLSITVKSKAFLVFGSLFLVGYIFKLTGEYFSNSFGWPLSLVLAGFLIMAVGYYTVRINKKYLTTV